MPDSSPSHSEIYSQSFKSVHFQRRSDPIIVSYVKKMPPLAPSLLLLALLPSLALGAACSDEQNEYSYGIYESAALTLGCSSISTISASGVQISYKCSDTDCLPVLRQLEYQLPDCENQNGDNLKYNLQQNLYGSCGLCDNDQHDTVMSLYTAAAQSDACAEYSYVSSTYVSITWPCSATSCSAVIADMADQLPSCIEDGENVKTYAQNLDCYSSNDVDETEAPSTDTTTDTSTDSTTPEPTATEAPFDATSASSDWSTPEPSYDDYTYAPATFEGSPSSYSASSYSYDSCSTSEVSDMASQYYDTATSSACDSYSTVSNLGSYYYIYIYTPCSSDCASSLRDLDDELPDCYYDYEFTNKKKELAEALTVCDSRRRLSIGRQLEQEASYDYISIMVYVEGEVPGGTSAASIAGGNSAPNSASPSMLTLVVAMLVVVVGLLRD